MSNKMAVSVASRGRPHYIEGMTGKAKSAGSAKKRSRGRRRRGGGGSGAAPKTHTTLTSHPTGRAAYTERQQQAMRANGASFVYTPQVLLQGRDFPQWRTDAAAIEAAARTPSRATLTVVASGRC